MEGHRLSRLICKWKSTVVVPIPNIISALRIPGAICLLFIDPASVSFWAIYGLCGISDMLDGYLARKLHAESKTGAVLDSVADLCFVACCAIRLLPVVQIPTDCQQKLLLPSYQGQQIDRFPSLPHGSCLVLVYRPHCHRCRCRHIRSRAGRPHIICQ